MSNYTQTTYFGPKDSLPLGNPAKYILGTDVDTELANIATAITSKYDSSSIQGISLPFGNGSVSAPSMSFLSDTTTGFYRAAAETIGVAANGVEVATIAQTLVTLASGVGLTVGGALTVSTGGSSIKGQLTIASPAAATPSLIVNGTAGTNGALYVVSGSSSTQANYDLEVARAGSTANNVIQGPNASLYDSVNGGASVFQQSGGQTELWQFNGSWRQIARWLSSANPGGQIMQIPDDGGTMQNVGYRGTPFNVQTSNYTLALSDRGKNIVANASITLTVPASVFSQGDVLSITANNGSTATIAAGSGFTLYWANGTSTSGNRTLTGMGVATLVFLTSNSAYITGSGLS